MKPRHNSSKSDKDFIPEEGQRDLLCRNKKSLRCPSLGINPNEATEDMLLDYLASILVKIYLRQKENEYQQQKGGALLPGVHKRTS
jgi:hypothetical protein